MSKQGPLGEKKQRLSIKRFLAEGSLLEDVALDGNSVKLILKEKYNNREYYASINNSLYDLHKTSTAFQAKFEQPKQGKHVPCLELKSDHGYADGQSVQRALMVFALRKQKLSVKAAFAAGSLLEDVALEKDNVRLILKEKYNNLRDYVSINVALYNLYTASTAFQAKFEQPKHGKSAPCLTLKPDHGYADVQSVKHALMDFVSPKEKTKLNVKAGLAGTLLEVFASKVKLNIREALAKRSLLERVELDGDNVRLILKEKYNHSDHYISINHALYLLHRASLGFQAKFELPKQGDNEPTLKLKPGHDYLDSQAVQDALVSFASPKEKLNVKEALAAGSLLEGVELVDDNVRLILKEKHKNPADYGSINNALYYLFKGSLPFQDKFEQPKGGNKPPCLKLKTNHGYKDSQAVQAALIGFASPAGTSPQFSNPSPSFLPAFTAASVNRLAISFLCPPLEQGEKRQNQIER